MLIKVFGIWLMANSISHLSPTFSLIGKSEDCAIIMNSNYQHNISKTCEEVAAEINKQIKASKE